MTTINNLSDDEMKALVKTISGPTYRYLLKRINHYILTNKDNADMSVNAFISTIVVTLACIDANVLRWLAQFYKENIGSPIDSEKLRMVFIKNLNEQLGIKPH